MKETLKKRLEQENYKVIDCGNTVYDKDDDFSDFVAVLADKMRRANKHSLGVVLCGSGVGVSIAANRFRGLYCVLGFDRHQVEHARAWDHANVIALPAEYIPVDTALDFIHIMIHTPKKQEERMLRRVRKLDLL
jgi:ribose 5-phosphate isomerase B